VEGRWGGERFKKGQRVEDTLQILGIKHILFTKLLISRKLYILSGKNISCGVNVINTVIVNEYKNGGIPLIYL